LEPLAAILVDVYGKIQTTHIDVEETKHLQV
jgi:hypothetical protein